MGLTIVMKLDGFTKTEKKELIFNKNKNSTILIYKT